MRPLFWILTCVLGVLVVIVPSSLLLVGLFWFVMAWFTFLKQANHTARIQIDMQNALDDGVTYGEQGDHSKAIDQFNTILNQPPRILNRFPNIDIAYFNRGNAHYLMNNLTDALHDYNQALNYTPQFTDVLINRGSVHSEQGNHQKALDDYQKAIRLMPERSPGLDVAYHNAGNAYTRLGDDEQAIKSYGQALSRTPRYVDALTAQGLVYEKLKHYTKAIHNFSQVIQLKQENQGDSPGLSRMETPHEAAYYDRANVYFKKRDYIEAIQDYTQIININPDSISAYESRAMANCYLDNNQDSLEDFVHISTVAPSANSHYNLSILQDLLGMKKEALASINMALSLDEQFLPAYYLRWNLHYDLEEQEVDPLDLKRAEAIEVGQSDTMQDEDAHGFYQRGLARYRRGNRQGAISDIEKVIQICQILKYVSLSQQAEQLLTTIGNAD